MFSRVQISEDIANYISLFTENPVEIDFRW